jgi:hypothetical protein
MKWLFDGEANGYYGKGRFHIAASLCRIHQPDLIAYDLAQ